jgi:hypothetical protein
MACRQLATSVVGTENAGFEQGPFLGEDGLGSGSPGTFIADSGESVAGGSSTCESSGTFLPETREVRGHAFIGLSGVSQPVVWPACGSCFAAIEAILHTVVRDANGLMFIRVSMP